jgi:hypothetical protein
MQPVFLPTKKKKPFLSKIQSSIEKNYANQLSHQGAKG